MNFVKLFVIILSASCYGQNIMVDYKFSIIDDKDDYGITGFSIIRLITNSVESISYSKNIDTVMTYKNNSEQHIQEATDFSLSSYKEFIVGRRYERTLFPKYNLKDENYGIRWELNDEMKYILGYQCYKATGSYRGRDYVAYYTTDIPIQNGPGPFGMLPGLILEVYSIDDVVKYKAFKIGKSNEKISNIFDEDQKEYISWEQFVKAYKSYFNKMINYKPDEETTIIVPNRSVEIYFED